MKLLHWLPLHWLPQFPNLLLPGLLSPLLGIGLTVPAWAGQVTAWRYDAAQQQLEFTTDEGVQPRAQLVFEPTRLVIDLPGTSLGDVAETQSIGGAVQQVRLGQFDNETTRIVVELAPGYTLDPQQVKFRGISPTQWVVQLPQPQAAEVAQSVESSSPTPSNRASQTTSRSATSRSATSQTTSRSTAARTDQTSSQTPSRALGNSTAADSSPTRTQANAVQVNSVQVHSVQVTDTGLRIDTEGQEPQVSIQRSRSGRSITVRIEAAELSPRFRGREQEVERHEIDDLEVDETEGAVEIQLDVSRRSPDWQAQVNRQGDILLAPAATVATTPAPQPRATGSRATSPRATGSRASTTPDPLPTAPPAAPNTPAPNTPAPNTPAPTSSVAPRVQMATVEGIDLDVSGTQLLIQTDRPVAYEGQWQGGMYVVTLSPAQLAAQVAGPQLTPADPLRRVRLRQVDDQTVAISIQPTTGVQFGSLNLITPQMLALEMQRPVATNRPPNTPSRPLPSVIPNGRIVVVIDPGHGGEDVGAVGIGNLHEADVVLSISQKVTALLQQQGIYAVMTRTSDVEVELEPRVQMAEQIRANLFVSIHANSMGMDRPDVNGIETYYYANGEGLAEVIQNSIISEIDMKNRGVKQARFYVLRHTSMPAVLVETGYVTGEEDAPRLADVNFHNQMAVAIARGVLQYIQQNSLMGHR